ncbi:MAG: putative repeat protein (TIGR01451 family), partial [Pirellulaceae bacterium]
PPSIDGRESQLTVGKANSSVTWSAPGLAIKLDGPQQLQGGQVADYRIEVTNTGDMPLTQVRVQDALPRGLRLLQSNPQANQFADRLEWSLTDIAPQSTSVIQIRCQAEIDGTLRHCVSAVGGGLQHSDCMDIQVFTSALSLDVGFPQTAEQGQTVTLQINVTNSGQQPLTGLITKITFSEGLKHVQPNVDTGPTLSIEQGIPDIVAGGFRSVPAQFIVTQPGRHWATVIVTANGSQSARVDKELTATASRTPEPRYGLQIEKQGPQRLRVGDTAQFVIFVKNTGDTALTNVVVSDTYERSFRPTKATEGYNLQTPGELRWNIPRLEPGVTQRFDIDCLCVRADNGAQNQASVTCDQGIRDDSQTVTEVIGAIGAGGAVGGIHPADTGPQVGDVKRLVIEVADFADVIKVGGETEYIVTLKNPLQMSHKDVVVTLIVPPGMSIRKVEAEVPTKSVERNKAVLERIAELRAGETFPPIRVFVTGDRAGTFELKASAVSNLVREPVEGKEQTRVVK